MMHHCFRDQIVETSGVVALGSRLVDLEQSFGLGPADRLMYDSRRRQDAFAPGDIVGIEFAGEMHPAPGGGALARDHAIADDRQRAGGSFTAGDLGRFEGGGSFSRSSQRGGHLQVLFAGLGLTFLFWACGRKRVVNETGTMRFFQACRFVAVTSVTVQGMTVAACR